jgi:Cupredoxin-like domain
MATLPGTATATGPIGLHFSHSLGLRLPESNCCRSRAGSIPQVRVELGLHRPLHAHGAWLARQQATVKNLDAAAIEFESVSLRVEKVVAAGSEGVVHVRAMAPGRYEFFDDFHQQTRGILVVQ